MDRRRSLLKIAALRSEREQQEGVDCTKGYLQSQDAGLLFEGPRTLECFFKYIPSDKIQVIAGFGISMIEIYALTTNQLRVYCGGGNATVDIIPGDSYLVDVAYDGTTAICYLNGTEAARFPVTGYKITDLFRTGSNTYIPQGSLVFCRHYNYAISAEEVAAHYNDGDPAGYVLSGAYKRPGNIYVSNFTTSTEQWTTLDGSILTYDEANHVLELDSVANRHAHMFSPVSYDTRDSHVYDIEVVIDANPKVTRCDFYPYTSADPITLPVEYLEETTVFRGVYIPRERNSFSGNIYCYFRLSTSTIVRVRSIRVLPVGCVAEYLPQNLVRSPHDDPVEIVGENSYTWTGVDSPYSHSVALSRKLSTDSFYRVKITVSDYESGIPDFKISANNTTKIPAANGTYAFDVQVKGTPYPYVLVYAGPTGSDRRVTITVDSIEPIPGVAISWLDSAKQLPLNDEYLPPLFESIVIGDATPIHITGKNSYTWTGVDAPVSFNIKINRVLSVGGVFRITGSVSNYKSGTPYLNLGNSSIAYLPKDNSPFTLVVTLKKGSSTLLPYIYIYGGSSSEDKQLTITVDSIEPIVEHSYDLTANGMPQIIIK